MRKSILIVLACLALCAPAGFAQSAKYSPVKPSKAKTARELVNELPAFPSAEQIAQNDDAFRNHFFDQIYAVTNRAEELKNANRANKEKDDARRRENMQKGAAASASPELSGVVQGNTSELSELSKLASIDPNAMASFMEANSAKIEKLGSEFEKLSEKMENGTATDADYERAQQLSDEMQKLTMQMMSAMGGGVDINSLMSLADEAEQAASNLSAPSASSASASSYYKVQFDKDFNAFLDKVVKFDAPNQRDARDAGSAKEQENIANINSLFQKIWAADNDASVKQLYSQVNSLIEDFDALRAQARVDEYSSKKSECLSLISEAEKFASTFPSDSWIARYDVLNEPLHIVEIYCSLMMNIWGGSEDAWVGNVVDPIKKERIKLPLQAGDEVYVAESSIYQMLDDSKTTSVVAGPKSSDTIVEDFIANSVFLVRNHNDGYFYKIEKGKRSRLSSTYNDDYDFSAHYKQEERGTVDIPMKSLNRKLTFTAGNDLCIPIPQSDGQKWYHPIAIQRTADWLVFITLEDNGDFTKCMFRL